MRTKVGRYRRAEWVWSLVLKKELRTRLFTVLLVDVTLYAIARLFLSYLKLAVPPFDVGFRFDDITKIGNRLYRPTCCDNHKQATIYDSAAMYFSSVYYH